MLIMKSLSTRLINIIALCPNFSYGNTYLIHPDIGTFDMEVFSTINTTADTV